MAQIESFPKSFHFQISKNQKAMETQANKPMTVPTSSFDDRQKNDIPLMVNGTYPAILVKIVDEGTKDVTFEGNTRKRRTVKFAFEFPLKKELWYVGDTEARPQVLSVNFTYLVGTSKTGKKSNLRLFLESMRGGLFLSDQEASQYDISQLLGKFYNASVIQAATQQGKMYNKIQNVTPFQNYWPNEYSQGLLNQTNPSIIFSIDNDGFESMNFAKLYAWERKELKESYEGQAHLAKGGGFAKLDENGVLVIEGNTAVSAVGAPPAPAVPQNQGPAHIEMIDRSATYEAFLAAGWTDEILIQHGKARLKVATPVAPAPPAPAVPTPPQAPQPVQAVTPTPATPQYIDPVAQFTNTAPQPVQTVQTPQPVPAPAVGTPMAPNVAPTAPLQAPNLPTNLVNDDLPF
jgi:hypothetical protein